MDLLGAGEKIVSVATAVVPEHLKLQAKAWLSDFNPFSAIKTNGDLTRAVRLAWIEAALAIVGAVESSPTAKSDNGLRLFVNAARPLLKGIRDATYNRQLHLAESPIDAHAENVFRAIWSQGASGNANADLASLTAGFAKTLAEAMGWPVLEIPSLVEQLAATGVPTGDGFFRPFGELVADAFADLLNDPDKFPQALSAFHTEILGRIAASSEETADKVGRLEGKFDSLIPRLMQELDARGAREHAIRGGVADEAIMKFARRLKPSELLDFDGAVAAVEHAVEIAIQSVQNGVRGTNSDDSVNSILRQVAQKIASGDLDAAANELNSELRILDRQEEQLRRDRGALIRQAIQVDLLRRDPIRVVERIIQRVRLESSSGVSVDVSGLREEYRRFFDEGRNQGYILSLEVAVELARRIFEVAPTVAEKIQWRRHLVEALVILGEREKNTARLEEAVQVGRAALASCSRQQFPLEWSALQNALGVVLLRLGQRQAGTTLLEEALAAFQSSLEELAPQRNPDSWAGRQNNIGNTLRRIGERETELIRYEKAIEAHKAALTVRKRMATPYDWAMSQNDLGLAWLRLGERSGDPNFLIKAVRHFHRALRVRTLEQTPIDWGMTQNNLGLALVRLGALQGNKRTLERAVNAFREALRGRTFEKTPQDWAQSTNNLGNSLRRLAELGEETHLDEVVQLYRAALQVYTKEHAAFDWAMVQNGLGIALALLGRRDENIFQFEQAIVAFELALEIYTRDAAPLSWAMVQANLGAALQQIGERKQSLECLRKAVATHRLVLDVQTRDRDAMSWALDQNRLGNAIRALGEHERDLVLLMEAREAYLLALEEVTEARSSYHRQGIQSNLAELDAFIESLRAS